MHQTAANTRPTRRSRRRQARAGAVSVRPVRAAPIAGAWILVLPLLAGVSAIGQSPFPATTSSGSADVTASPDSVGSPVSSDTVANPADARSLTAPANNPEALALSSNQIVDLLQRSPDLAVELKSLAADRMQAQGAQIDANDISDQMLYDQIAANASFRASITTFLRARGYISEDDLQASATEARGFDPGATAISPQTGAGLPGAADAVRSPEALASSSPQLPVGGNANPAALMGPAVPSDVRANRGEERGNERANASTDAPQVLRRPAPYNLHSMRDLYTQIPDQTAPLRRFGSQVFMPRESSAAARGLSG